ncbi:UNVERIFIED_CONTAM: GDT1-like protein 4 [Sesamum calycinum]|uniref:GDT1 family protein n=1 Tax=Sesamum calycinum TaxID=2727403 RepID=A0AAW2RR02_9LAMI
MGSDMIQLGLVKFWLFNSEQDKFGQFICLFYIAYVTLSDLKLGSRWLIASLAERHIVDTCIFSQKQCFFQSFLSLFIHPNEYSLAVLYAFFGLRLLYIAWRSDSKASQKKEMEEVEEKLEAGQGKTTIRRFFSRFCTPIYLESFILTFLAEWGDRSQIATIALATHKNAVGVAVGATIGHTICTSLAVIGGSMLASKISQRTVATVGGLLFLGFSLSSYFYPPL